MLVFTPYKRDFKRKQFNAPRPHKVTTPNVAASGRGLQSSPSVVNTVHSEVRRRRGSGLAREDVNAIGAKKKTPRRGVKFRLNGKINRYARGLKN